jgi:hypothetical protein
VIKARKFEVTLNRDKHLIVLILVLEWIMGEISGDHTVEVVTDAMLDKLVSERKNALKKFDLREVFVVV